MPSDRLSGTTILKLNSIFQKNGWSLDVPHCAECYNRFCNMLSYYSSPEQYCILRLMETFLKIDGNEYIKHILKALHKIDRNTLSGINNIYVMPIINDNEQIKVGKSSLLVAYLLEGKDLIVDANLSTFKISVIYNTNSLPVNFNTEPDLLLLVDDFIGSGDSVIKCLNNLRTKISQQKIIVLSLVIQNIGYELLINEQYQVIYSVLRKKGITDSYLSPEKEILTKTMEKIENKLDVSPILKFGYKQTEALVKMIRTPNNTFPIFWFTPTKQNINYTPPFER